MSALVRKEIRLLRPVWVTALLLIVAPIPLGQIFEYDDSVTFFYTAATAKLTLLGLAVGCSLLGLAGFGREMSSRTFSLLLSQPRPRREFWRAKIGVLLGSIVVLALFLGLVSWQFIPPAERWDTAFLWMLTACVAVTGGLWTTLLFRQVIASFWVSVLVPFAILASVMSLDDDVAEARTHSIIVILLLLAYSVAGYLFARWQFRHAQDTAWTGGNVSLPDIGRWLPWKRTAMAHRKTHPLRALLGKEFQFQQVNFLLAGLLLVVQVAMLLLHRFVNTSERSVLDMIAQNFLGIWIVMPLLVGCGAVAEERKLGTLEPQLCLPVARAWQFAVKVFVTLVCGLVLGALVPVAITLINTRGTTPLEFVVPWTLACVGLALVAFYASSLTHQLLQALGAAVGIIVVGLFLGSWVVGSLSRGSFILFGAVLWRGPLVFNVGAGVMLLFAMVLTWRRWRWVWISLLGLIALALFRGRIQSLFAEELSTEARFFGVNSIPGVGLLAAMCPVALTLALAAQNFKHTQTSLSLWWRNSALWLGCLVITGVLTTLVYNRVWEFAMRFEPPAGAPRLSGPVRPVIAGWFLYQPTFVLLPDGRLCSYQEYERIPTPNANADSEPALRAIKNPKVEFIGGSNWVAIATTGREFGGVKSDGSLWRASWFEQVDQQGKVARLHVGSPQQKNSTLRAAALKFERVGDESTWVTVAASWSHFVALKRDGTLWGWGDNGNKQLDDASMFVTNAPVQIGQSANWTAVYAGAGHSYAVNREGEIWKWGTFATHNGRKIEEGPVKLNIKVPGVRGVIEGNNTFDLILDTDGNLWGLGAIPAALSGREFGGLLLSFHPIRLGGTNWLSVSCNWQGLAGLKTDGTLWSQRGLDSFNGPPPTLVQLGQRTDWVAVMSDWGADLALAKDGTICRFGEPTFNPTLLVPTRRVTWSANLLEAAK